MRVLAHNTGNRNRNPQTTWRPGWSGGSSIESSRVSSTSELFAVSSSGWAQNNICKASLVSSTCAHGTRFTETSPPKSVYHKPSSLHFKWLDRQSASAANAAMNLFPMCTCISLD
eukprot:2156906-Amphidinium_carterae.1